MAWYCVSEKMLVVYQFQSRCNISSFIIIDTIIEKNYTQCTNINILMIHFAVAQLSVTLDGYGVSGLGLPSIIVDHF